MTQNGTTARAARPIVFGEVLFDCFENGQQVLGGAPFNVAWNLQGLGESPLFLSATGDDERGRSVVETMKHWNLDTNGVQVVDDRPTGTVQVTVKNGQPSYEIVEDQAYDAINEARLLDDCYRAEQNVRDILYCGTLALRGSSNRDSVQQLLDRWTGPRFVDLNLRPPHFDHEWLPGLLKNATWVKLNDEELATLTDRSIHDSASIAQAVAIMCDRYGQANYLVTCGSRGAHALMGDESFFQPAVKPNQLIDTVGAGDAFAAATIAGLLNQVSMDLVLAAAARLASRVCAFKGATTTDRAVYQNVFSS